VLVLNHVFYEVKRWQGDRNFMIGDVEKAFDINVFSYIDLATLFLPSLQASRGRLLVISSGLGVVTYPYFALYCSNKHALHGFFNALRQDLALEKNEMSITLTVLGAIATDNAVKVSHGNPLAGTGGWTRHSSEDASRAVVEASLHRERQIYFPSSLKLHEFASTHFPDFTESLIRYVYGLNV
jgi:short-subunit dehydrogenase